jgi:hypothetical protein
LRVFVGKNRFTEASAKWGQPLDLSEKNMTTGTYAHIENYQQTDLNSQSGPMILLEICAAAEDRAQFDAVAKAVNWKTRLPEEFFRALGLALRLEMPDLAFELAQLGKQAFPDNQRAQEAAQILTPTTIRTVKRTPIKGLRESNAWIREHADAYRGQWVAVREGHLLASAPTMKALRQIIGIERDPVHTLITKIL